MDGGKMARIRRCHECPHRSTRHTTVWDWPHCDWGGSDLELSDEFMTTGQCPAGYWLGLTPVDLEAEAEAQAAARIERERHEKMPVIEGALGQIDDVGRQESFLVDMVDLGFISAAR